MFSKLSLPSDGSSLSPSLSEVAISIDSESSAFTADSAPGESGGEASSNMIGVEDLGFRSLSGSVGSVFNSGTLNEVEG